MDDLSLTIVFTFDPPSGLYTGHLENGARFSIAPNHLGGKLLANLDLLRKFTMREREGKPPHPHPSAPIHDKDRALVEEAIAAGRIKHIRPKGPVTLEDLGL